MNKSLRGTSFDLLILRSLCDLGLALKFIFDPYVSKQLICGHNECVYSVNIGIEKYIYMLHISYVRRLRDVKLSILMI